MVDSVAWMFQIIANGVTSNIQIIEAVEPFIDSNKLQELLIQ